MKAPKPTKRPKPTSKTLRKGPKGLHVKLSVGRGPQLLCWPWASNHERVLGSGTLGLVYGFLGIYTSNLTPAL